ncbi:MAG: type III polyketide synthase [Bacteroidetes bacterium]|nr:type III polyketide synthase [Bacteroidota bacterium]
MAYISAVETVDFPYKLPQGELKKFASNLFSDSFENINRLLEVFDNTGIHSRNLCVPVDFFLTDVSFAEKNNLFQKISLEYSALIIEKILAGSKISKEDITDIIYFTSTGLTTPSLDAIIINKLRLNSNANRIPVWGLGCAAGVSALAKAKVTADANPDAVILLLGVELCSLTFIRNDLSKSNFIATSLFSDGMAAALVLGENSRNHFPLVNEVKLLSSESKLYYDSEDVMGWEFIDEGFKVVFSKDIPGLIGSAVKKDFFSFLDKNRLSLNDIQNFVIHPGGMKVIEAYINNLSLEKEKLSFTTKILQNYGNMSSVTVLYVLKKFLKEGYKKGKGMMMSLGPGFSCEMLLLEMQ